VTACGFEGASVGLQQLLQFLGGHDSIVNFGVDSSQQLC
jgi:hypothetical protein